MNVCRCDHDADRSGQGVANCFARWEVVLQWEVRNKPGWAALNNGAGGILQTDLANETNLLQVAQAALLTSTTLRSLGKLYLLGCLPHRRIPIGNTLNTTSLPMSKGPTIYSQKHH